MNSLLPLLRAQDGLVHRDQLVDLGWSPSAILRRVDSGDWRRVHPRVYHAVDHPWTPRARLRAAGMWLPEGGTLTGRAAAAWWRLSDEVPDLLTAAVPPGAGHGAPTGVRVSRRDLVADDRLQVDGLWVTRRPLTVLEGAVESGLTDGARLMDRCLQRGAVSLDDLRAVLRRHERRHGAVLARHLVDLAAGAARSQAERTAHRELRAAGIGGWIANHEVMLPGWGRVVLDLAFPRLRLAIEVDGWAFHRDVDRFRRDALRQNEVVIGGWRVLRVTWYELREHPTHFVDTVRRAALTAAA